MKHDFQRTTKTEHRVTVYKDDLLAWLKRKEGLTAPFDKATATITVPSGGDYSGQTLDVNEVGGIVVCWSEECTE